MKFTEKYYGILLTALWMMVGAAIYYGCGYFGSLLEAHTNFGFAFENNIPVVPLATIIYFTVYFVWLTPLFFVFSKEKLRNIAAAYLFTVLVMGLIWILFPTRMIWEPFIAKSIPDGLIVMLRGMDSSYCLFPSMHMTWAYLAAFIVSSENRKWGVVITIIATFIAFSTLFVRQHYAVDVVVGFALALFAYVFFVRKR